MVVVRTPAEAHAATRALARPLALVPTMGALHAGHVGLIDAARRENASVAASLFVNPLQFGPHEDFERYPRDFARDADTFARAGVALLYAPSVDAMYPPGFATSIEPGPAARGFEGESRPGHFSGVATVVVKLLNAVGPDTAYFGQKDAQQVAVIRSVVRDLDMPVRVVVVPTLRESDGLALSSRNVYLQPLERAAAPSFHRALAAVARALGRGECDVRSAIDAIALDAPLVLEYAAVVDPDTFEPLETVRAPALVVGVARAGATRLLDNVPVAFGGEGEA